MRKKKTRHYPSAPPHPPLPEPSPGHHDAPPSYDEAVEGEAKDSKPIKELWFPGMEIFQEPIFKG